jgi:nickel transport protein
MRRLFLLFAFLVAFTSNALAHKISAFVDVEDNAVHLVSYFSDGTPVKHGKVEVLNSAGKVVLTGTTNDKGEFDFTLKKPGTYTAVVVAELGHRAKAQFTVGEAGSASDNSNSGGSASAAAPSPAPAAPSKGVAVSERELRKIIREELDPIHRELLKIEEQNAKVSFKDVVAGLGWIMGIFGAAALALSYRRKGGSGSLKG